MSPLTPVGLQTKSHPPPSLVGTDSLNTNVGLQELY